MTEQADLSLIPPPPARWKLCDIDALLQAQDFATLDHTLSEALAASLHDRDGEERYTGAFPPDMQALCDAGAAGLARLREWQAQAPASAHAHFCEAHYWYHWAYEYRGSGWASTVTAQGWALAHACAARAFIAGLRAIELEPRLWAVPALLLQVDSAFQTPDWLTRLLSTGSHPPHTIAAHWLELHADEQEDLYEALQKSGLHLEPTREGPTARPAGLMSAAQNRKVLSGLNYWMPATLQINPNAYFFLRQCVWFMQPRWGGSHERVRAFVASPTCAHLSELEKDRLLHEIWRDDYLQMSVDANDDDADVAQWRAATRQRMEQALYPYHRYETALWLANSHYEREEYPAALPLFKEAEQHHPIDTDLTLSRSMYGVLAHMPGEIPWLVQAAKRSAESYACAAALVLHGYCTAHGLLGVARDPERGEAWLEAARQQGKGTMAWNMVANRLAYNGYPADGYAVAQLGWEAGGDSCDYLLGIFHEDGVHVKADPRQAAVYYRKAFEEGGNNGAYRLSVMYAQLADRTSDARERNDFFLQAIDAARHAHEMGHTEGLDAMLQYIADLEGASVIEPYLPLVRQHAEAGLPTAMAALSALLANDNNRPHANYDDSVRWILGAQAIAPDDVFVANVFKVWHQDGFIARALFKLTKRGIKPHEIPGTDNQMV